MPPIEPLPPPGTCCTHDIPRPRLSHWAAGVDGLRTVWRVAEGRDGRRRWRLVLVAWVRRSQTEVVWRHPRFAAAPEG